MANSTSNDAAKAGQPQQPLGGQAIDSRTASLSAAEIESLLRIARENASRQEITEPAEELGPGDVQHLRGRSLSYASPAQLSETDRRYRANPGAQDAALDQVEQQLADAILASSAADRGLPQVRSDSRTAGKDHLTLDDLGQIDLDISIELGRTEILIEDVLKLREGSVVALDKLAGDPVDIVANGRLVARGELLVIDGKFGVRLSEVL